MDKSLYIKPFRGIFSVKYYEQDPVHSRTPNDIFTFLTRYRKDKHT
jgi:hypothetical protein